MIFVYIVILMERSPKEYDGTSEIFEDGVKVTEKYYIDGNEDLN